MLTDEQMALLNKYLSLVNIKGVYTQTTAEPITYKGKIINISNMFATPSKKTVTVDIPLGESTKVDTTTEVDNSTPSATSTMYTTQILRITIKLDATNISWLLNNEPDLQEIATAFFEQVKTNYLNTQQLPDTLKQFMNKTF